MPLLDSLQDGLDRILPRRNKPVLSKSVSGGIGTTVGVVRFQDDVRWLPFFLAALPVVLHLNLDEPSNFGYVIFPSLLLSAWVYGPVGHAGLSPLRTPPMGRMARGHFFSFVHTYSRDSPLTPDDYIQTSHHIPHLSSLFQLPRHGLFRQRRKFPGKMGCRTLCASLLPHVLRLTFSLPAGLTGFALFVSITGIFLSLFLLFVPVVYEKYDKFARLARALQELRVGFILTGLGCTFSLLIACVVFHSALISPFLMPSFHI